MSTPMTVRFAITIPSISNGSGTESERHLLLTMGLSLEVLNVEGSSVPLKVSLLPEFQKPEAPPEATGSETSEEPAPLNDTGSGPGIENPDPTGGG